jgi:nucleoside-diphosphate-sugar epimerase
VTSETKILVTGAGGFIGGWLVELLYLTGHRNVRAGIRRWSSGARIGRFPVEIVLCDVLNYGQVAQALRGIDAVIHCATGPANVIVKGTENLLQASSQYGLKKFIHLSTIDVYGNAAGEVDETFPMRPTREMYGVSKIDAERICWTFAEKGLPVVVIRPSVVYGPYSKLWVTKLAERLRSGKWGTLRQIGEGLCNLVYVQDLITAIFLCLKSEKATGQAFNISGPEVITWNEYFRRFNAALGLPPLHEIRPEKARMRSMLMMPLKSTARYILNHHGDVATKLYRRFDLAKKVMQKTEESFKTSPGLAELAVFSRQAQYNISKARSLLGYDPNYSVDAGLEMCVRWLAHEHLWSKGK